MYDYSARYMEPAIGRSTTVDPMAEKYYSISPYAYVGNNPIRRTDPTGMKWLDELSKKFAEQLSNTISKEVNSLRKDLDKAHVKLGKTTTEKGIAKLESQITELNANIDNLVSGIDELKDMGDPTTEQTFAYNLTDDVDGGLTSTRSDGVIVMNIGGNGNKALGAHESSHGYDVWKGGYPTTGDGLYATEVKAYGRQYSLSGSSSMPKSAWGGVGRLGDVNNQYVGGIKDSGGVYMYARQA